MKNLITILFILLGLGFLFIGCGDENDDNDTEDPCADAVARCDAFFNDREYELAANCDVNLSPECRAYSDKIHAND